MKLRIVGTVGRATVPAGTVRHGGRPYDSTRPKFLFRLDWPSFWPAAPLIWNFINPKKLFIRSNRPDKVGRATVPAYTGRHGGRPYDSTRPKFLFRLDWPLFRPEATLVSDISVRCLHFDQTSWKYHLISWSIIREFTVSLHYTRTFLYSLFFLPPIIIDKIPGKYHFLCEISILKNSIAIKLELTY